MNILGPLFSREILGFCQSGHGMMGILDADYGHSSQIQKMGEIRFEGALEKSHSVPSRGTFVWLGNI
jgi:hypothetical protein